VKLRAAAAAALATLCAGSLWAGPASAALAPGNHRIALQHDGRSRSYIVHVPPAAAESGALPVVINFHGGGGNAESQQKYSRMHWPDAGPPVDLECRHLLRLLSDQQDRRRRLHAGAPRGSRRAPPGRPPTRLCDGAVQRRHDGLAPGRRGLRADCGHRARGGGESAPGRTAQPARIRHALPQRGRSARALRRRSRSAVSDDELEGLPLRRRADDPRMGRGHRLPGRSARRRPAVRRRRPEGGRPDGDALRLGAMPRGRPGCAVEIHRYGSRVARRASGLFSASPRPVDGPGGRDAPRRDR